jgi:hypothetical protein
MSMKIVELLVVANVGNSPHAIRFALEYIGYRVNIHYIATARQLMVALDSVQPESFVLIDGHGREEGLVLDELGEEYAALEPFDRFISAENFATFLKLPSCSVINLSCDLGREDFADVFLKAGAKAYIGALGYPDGSSALIYAQLLFYLMHNHKLSLKEAHEKARDIDDETRIYTLYEAARQTLG